MMRGRKMKHWNIPLCHKNRDCLAASPELFIQSKMTNKFPPWRVNINGSHRYRSELLPILASKCANSCHFWPRTEQKDIGSSLLQRIESLNNDLRAPVLAVGRWSFEFQQQNQEQSNEDWAYCPQHKYLTRKGGGAWLGHWGLVSTKLLSAGWQQCSAVQSPQCPPSSVCSSLTTPKSLQAHSLAKTGHCEL